MSAPQQQQYIFYHSSCVNYIICGLRLFYGISSGSLPLPLPVFLYRLIPVPAGISFPIIVLPKPYQRVGLAFNNAGEYRVVSWKDAANRRPVARDAFVIPRHRLWPVFRPPPPPRFSSSNLKMSTSPPGSKYPGIFHFDLHKHLPYYYLYVLVVYIHALGIYLLYLCRWVWTPLTCP